MRETILQTLFLDNPEISGEIKDFCDNIPEYVQAEREYNRVAEELTALVGYERYSRLEAVINWYFSIENQAYYLFGLGLRREILDSLTG